MQTPIVRAFLLTLFLAFTAPAVANADPAHEAAEYYNQATTAYQAGDYQAAADLLDLAFGKNPDLVYKYNRILALQAAGDAETALADLNALYNPMKADSQGRFDDIDEIRAQLEAIIASRAEPEQPVEPQEPRQLPEPSQPAPSRSSISPAGLATTIASGMVLTTGILFSTEIFVPEKHLACLARGGRTRQCDHNTTWEGSKRVHDTHRIAALSLMGVGAIGGVVGTVLLLTHNSGGGTAGLDSLRVTPYIAQGSGGAVLQVRF